MLDLIIKDLVATRWFVAIVMPIYAAQLVGLSSSPPAFFVVTLLFTGLAAIGPLAVEEIQGTEILWCSLPLSRRDVVIARYGTTLLGIVAGLGASWVTGRLIGAVISSEASSTALGGVGAYAALFLFLATLAALFLPCYFLLGVGKGLFAFTLLSAVGAVILVLGGSTVMSLINGAEGLGDPRDLDPALVGAWIRRWSWVGPIVSTLIAIATTAVSAAVSVAFYRTRDC